MLSTDFAAIAKVDDLRQALCDAGYRYQYVVDMSPALEEYLGPGVMEETWLHPTKGAFFIRHQFGREEVIACESY